MKEQRREHKDMLLFDSGDFSQGSPYYNLFKGEVEIKMMNEMGYDAGTIGNHEFDFWPGQYGPACSRWPTSRLYVPIMTWQVPCWKVW